MGCFNLDLSIEITVTTCQSSVINFFLKFLIYFRSRICIYICKQTTPLPFIPYINVHINLIAPQTTD